jgi:hypothetical protein
MHGKGRFLCRALGRVAHGKDWFRRQVDQGLCRASYGGAHDKEWSRRPVDQALCHASCGGSHGKEWSICRVPRLAHGKVPIPAAILGQSAVREAHDARQIDLIYLFFVVHV